MRIFLFLAFFLGLGFSSHAQSLKVKLASDIWPPFTNVEGEQAFAIALVKEALQRSKIGMDAEILDFGEVTEGLREGKFDGSAAMWRNAEREKFLLFSDAYLENQLILVGPKGSNVSAGSFDDLQGKVVAVVGTYGYGAELDNAEGVEFRPGRNHQENLDRLLKGEVDYMLVDHLVVQYFLKYNEKEAKKYLAIGRKPLLRRSLHFAVRKDLPKGEFIIERFNQQIDAMLADGTYNRILQLNWIRADVDGDGRTELVLAGTKAGKSAPKTSYDVPSGSIAQQSEGPVNRYWINGKLYNSWGSVPKDYKVDIPPIEGQPMLPVQGFRF